MTDQKFDFFSNVDKSQVQPVNNTDDAFNFNFQSEENSQPKKKIVQLDEYEEEKEPPAEISSPPPEVPMAQSNAFDFTSTFATHTGGPIKISTPKARKSENFDWDFAQTPQNEPTKKEPEKGDEWNFNFSANSQDAKALEQSANELEQQGRELRFSLFKKEGINMTPKKEGDEQQIRGDDNTVEDLEIPQESDIGQSM